MCFSCIVKLIRILKFMLRNMPDFPNDTDEFYLNKNSLTLIIKFNLNLLYLVLLDMSFIIIWFLCLHINKKISLLLNQTLVKLWYFFFKIGSYFQQYVRKSEVMIQKSYMSTEVVLILSLKFKNSFWCLILSLAILLIIQLI